MLRPCAGSVPALTNYQSLPECSDSFRLTVTLRLILSNSKQNTAGLMHNNVRASVLSKFSHDQLQTPKSFKLCVCQQGDLNNSLSSHHNNSCVTKKKKNLCLTWPWPLFAWQPQRALWHCDTERVFLCVHAHIAVGTAQPACAGCWGCRLPAGSGCRAASLSAVWSLRGPWWRRCWQTETPELWGCWSESPSRHLLSYSPERKRETAQSGLEPLSYKILHCQAY